MKKFLVFLLLLAGGFAVLNISVKHTYAWCIPDFITGDICPIPPPAPDSTVTTAAPAPNTIHLNPPTTTWPDGGAFSGDKQPFYDVGNDTAYPKSANVIPVYLRQGDNINIVFTNASPDCQATDPATGLKYPDYSDNTANAGPPTTFSVSSVSSGVFRSQNVGSTFPCGNTVEFDNIGAFKGDCIKVSGTCVDSGGLSGSGYIKVVYLHISVNALDTVKGENAFRVQLVNNNTDGSQSNLGSSSDAVGYGRREASLAYGNVYTQLLVFGVDETCNNFDRHKGGSLVYTDMDANNLNWNPNIRIVLQREPWSDYPSFNNWTLVEAINNSTLRAQANNVLHSLSTTSFDNEFRYRLLLENVGVRNTIFIGMGGDISQVSGKYHEKSSDCSDFACTATPVDATDVRVSITNKGPHPIGDGFQVRSSDGQSWPATGFSANFSPGGTASHIFTRAANAIVVYKLFDGTGPNSENIPFNPDVPCSTAGTLSISCGNGSSPQTPPGNVVTSNYTYTVTNTTGTAHAAGSGYHAVATPVPGLSNPTGVSNDIQIAIPTGSGVAQNVNFKFTVNYQGSYSVRFFDPQNNPIGNPDPCPPVTITPSVAPYFQVWQNDAAGGGAFKIGDSCPGAYSAYQNPYTANAAGQANAKYYGGIRANNNAYHSKADFGAVALGLIPNPSGEGFISPHNTLFANSGVTVGGGISGYFNSTGASANHCATDFYSTTMINTPANTPNTNDLNSAVQNCLPDSNGERRCQYIWNGTDISGAQVSIPHGVQITVYVPSDITISTNIVYQQPFDPNIRADIPYFSLVVKGNITLTDGVTELDGLYIAQPNVTGSTASGGDFKTCDSQCPHQLIVNGAVIAQHVELLRAHGSSQSLGTDINGIGNAPAEIFNFVPSMVLGAPAFSPQSPTPEGLFSLPPVF